MRPDFQDFVLLAPILGDETRRRIFSHVIASEEAVTASYISSEFDIHRTVARMHLEKLARSQLLLRASVRSGQSGRPAVSYRARTEHVSNQKGSASSLLISLLLDAIGDQGATGLDSMRKSSRKIASAIRLPAAEFGLHSLCAEIERALSSIGRSCSAELHSNGAEVTISNLECPFNARAFENQQILCAADAILIQEVVAGICRELGVDASHMPERSTFIPLGEPVCRHVFDLSDSKRR